MQERTSSGNGKSIPSKASPPRPTRSIALLACNEQLPSLKPISEISSESEMLRVSEGTRFPPEGRKPLAALPVEAVALAAQE